MVGLAGDEREVNIARPRKKKRRKLNFQTPTFLPFFYAADFSISEKLN